MPDTSVQDKVAMLWGTNDGDRLALEPCGCRSDIPSGIVTKFCPRHAGSRSNAGAVEVTAGGNPERPSTAPRGLFGPRLVVIFSIAGDPGYEGRARARATPFGATVYTDSKTRRWKEEVRHAATRAMDGRPMMLGPVRLVVTVYKPRPAYITRKSRPNPAVWATTKPDWDNFGKAISDGCNGIVWKDDAQVVEATVRKYYHPGPGYPDAFPRVEVRVEEIAGAAR